MKKILLSLFITTLTALAHSQSHKPSGVVSFNGAQTVGVEKPYYASVEEYVDGFLVNHQIPAGITRFNGAYDVNGKYTAHGRAFFEAHRHELAIDALAYLRTQLWEIDKYTKGALVAEMGLPTNSDIKDISGYLIDHMSIEWIEFTGPVYLCGEKGDFTGPKFVQHNKADGWYYVLIMDSGEKFILTRVSCFNGVTLAETFWLFSGKAKIVEQQQTEPKEETPSEEGGDDSPPVVTKTEPRKVRINGKDVATASGDVNININTLNNPVALGGKGGSVTTGDLGSGNNSNNTTDETTRVIGETNPNYNPNQTTTTTVVQAVPYQVQYAQPQYYAQQPYYGQVYQQPSKSLSLSFSFGGGNNGGCYGGYNNVRQQQQCVQQVQQPVYHEHQRPQPQPQPTPQGRGPHMGTTIPADQVNNTRGGPHMGYTIP